MKKSYASLLLLFVSFLSTAQPQFTANNCFQLNDSSKVGFAVVSQSFDDFISQTGSNYTWDFTNIGTPGPWTSWTNPTTSYKFQPSSQSIHSVFQSTQINEYANVAFARDHFYTYSTSNDTLYFHGYYAGSNYPYHTPFPYLTFPLSYSDSVHNYTIQSSGNTSVGSVSRDWIYDGFGTVNFSYGTESNVFRIRTKQIDTSMVNGNFIAATILEEMIWFRQSDGIPILRFQKQGTSAIYVYYTSVSGTSGIFESSKNDSFYIYPNPTNDFIRIQSNSSLIGSPYVITDQIGRIMLTGKLIHQDATIDIRPFSSGMYLLQIGNSTNQRYKIIKE